MAGTSDSIVLTDVLDNGLRVAYHRVGGQVECCGVAIMAGSRDEAPDEYGLAHFVEHTIFKGTHRRRSHHVINRMEVVGGELNAYTTKEETFVYTLAPAHNTARAVELIADLIVNCSFPGRELEKEREVVADEICSYLDAPDAAVYDDFEDAIFTGSQLGHNILGTKRSVARLGSDDCHRWVERNFRAGRMAFFYMGPASARRVFDLVHRYLEAVPSGGFSLDRHVPVKNSLFDKARCIKSHQAHTVIGCRLDGLPESDHDVLWLVNNVLGGPGMNSWFNVSLRERRGLVYTVDSSVARYCDCVLWSVYFGCDDEHTGLCKRLIGEAIGEMADRYMTVRALNMAKRQFLGQLALSRASVENCALALGRCMLRGEPFRSLDRIACDFDAVTPERISNLAGRIISGGMSSLTFR